MSNNSSNQKIRIVLKKLSDKRIKKIPKGSCIGTPSDIVKELVENSIDANARDIHIEISNDLHYIKVKDDGIGIKGKNFPSLGRQYTTHKQAKRNTTSIDYFGYRGMALYDIIQFATKLTIKSRHNDCQMGYCALYQASDNEFDEEHFVRYPLNPGTEVEVEILPTYDHINIKEDFSYILNVISAFAVHFTNISFSVINKTTKCIHVFEPASDQCSDMCKYREMRIRTLFGIPSNVKFCHFKDTGSSSTADNVESSSFSVILASPCDCIGDVN